MAVQYTFRRVEKKYLLTSEQYARLMEQLRFRIHADEFGLHTITSLYYDTPDFQLIRTSLEHPVFKEKLRLRGYTDTALCFPEIKQKYKGVVYKRRIACLPEEWPLILSGQIIDGQSVQIQHEIQQLVQRHPNIAPRSCIAYDRTAYICNDQALRITFDQNLRGRGEQLSLSAGSVGTPILAPGEVVMEIKFPGSAPLWLAELLCKQHIFPTSFSKYGRWYFRECAGLNQTEARCMATG